MYEEIDSAEKKDGKISIETPSREQIWLYKENKVVAKLAPEKIEVFEKNIRAQINCFRKDFE